MGVRQFDGQGNPAVRSADLRSGDVEGAAFATRALWRGGNVALTDRQPPLAGAFIVHADAERANAARERLAFTYIRHEGTQVAYEAESRRFRRCEMVYRITRLTALSYDIRQGNRSLQL